MKQYLISKIKSTFARWLVSYLVILAIPVIFGVIIYGHALSSMEQESEYEQKQTLKQVKQNFDGQLNLLYNSAYGITNSDNVNNVAMPDADASYSPHQIERMSEIQKQIRDMLAINESISDIYLYFVGTDHILSDMSLVPMNKTQSSAAEHYGCTIDEVRAMTDNMDFKGKLSVVGEQQQTLVYTYVREIVPGRSDSRVMMYIVLDNKAVNYMLDSTNTNTWLLSEDGTLYSPISDNEMDVKYLDLLSGIHDDNEIIHKDGYYVLREKSEYYSWHYVRIMSQQFLLKKVNQMKWILFVYLIICIGGGGYASWMITQKSYLPVKELLNIVTGRNHPEGNDFVQLKESFQRMKEAYEQGEIRNRAIINKERSYLLSELIAGKVRSNYESELELWIDQVNYEEYLMIAIEIRSYMGKESQMMTSDDLDEAYFIVANVLHELLENRYDSIEAESEGMLLSILSRKDPKFQADWLRDDLIHRLMELKTFLQRHYEMVLMVNISDYHNGKEQIRDCFHDIQIEFEYRNRRRENVVDILTMDNIEDHQEERSYWKICRSINQLLAEKKVAEALRKLSELLPEPQENEKELVTEENKSSDQITVIMSQVKQYIDEHYCDNMLSVGALAERYQFKISYISRAYKRVYGCGILEYINSLRLARAKKLMEEGMTVKDVALQVGYFDTQPLVRLFRQMEGMTPSEYRNRKN